MTSIFKSNFTLEFNSRKIQEKYETMINKYLKKFNLIYSVINLIISISYFLIYAVSVREIKYTLYIHVEFLVCTMVIAQIVSILLSIFIRNITFHRWISYLNIGNFCIFSWTLWRYMASFSSEAYFIFNIIFLTQQMYLMSWFLTHNLNFYYGFWVYFSVSIVSLGIYAPVFPLKLHFRFFIGAYNIIFTSLMSYFYVHERKKSFYLTFKHEAKIKSNNGIIQNMNSGYISIKNSKIVSWNKSLYGYLTNIENKREENIIKNLMLIKGSEINNIISLRDFTSLGPEKTKILLFELFNDILLDSLQLTVQSLSDYQRVLDFVKNYDNDPTEKENFIFIGTQTIKSNGINIPSQYFEIYGRFCDNFNLEQEDHYEFIFNDVSKSKISADLNAEIKYKAIFLSKVAHEFKNPLLCVSELVDQVKDELRVIHSSVRNNRVSLEKVSDNLTQIKSVTEYLLILVKDLDFFSLYCIESTNKVKLEKENVELEGVIQYCQNITNILLKKFQKNEIIKYKTDCPHYLYQSQIFTDELRLKQLLINLLSNSVKYTYFGQITLQLKEENKMIVFSVIDTGRGLSEDQKKRINLESFDNREIGAYSSGLGFSIINEILDLFGSQLQYEETECKGSKFSFSLEKVENILENNLENIPDSLTGSFESFSSSGTLDEAITVKKSFSPDRNIHLLYEMRDQVNFLPLIEVEERKSSMKKEPLTDYYLVVDDEGFSRESTIRLLKSHFASKMLDERNKVILEASDGIECLQVFYDCMNKGIRLSFIISDQTMNFLDGEFCAKILNDIITRRGLRKIPFFILTAYENFKCDEVCVKKCFTKPLSMAKIEEMRSVESEF